MEVVAEQAKLPDPRFAAAWDSIKIARAVQDRLVAQSLLALTIRQKIPFEVAPLHGLIVLSGPPGTGKTTLARGLANAVASVLNPQAATFIQIDPHAITSSAHGKSQKEVTKLFQQTIPEMAAAGPVMVLLDEVETLVADRQQLSLEANPVDVHRATDAALSGLDVLTRQHSNVLLFATTNFPKALDGALLSRADLIEHIGPPDKEAREKIIKDVIEHFGKHWPAIGHLTKALRQLVDESEGLDGRRLRKAFVAAIALSIDTARDPNKLKASDVLASLQTSRVSIEGTC